MDISKKHLIERNKIMEEQTLCRKCYLKKHKLSKKHIDRIVFTPYVEKCDNCGKTEKLVDYIEEDEDEF